MATDNPKKKHSVLVPFDYSTLREDAVTFYVNNKVFEGFKNIKIARNLMSLTGNFSIVISDKWRINQEDFEIKPGDRIHCHIGQEALFEGWIDTYSASLQSQTRNITIEGRDRTSDLVDCSVVGKSEFNNLNILQIAKELCSPFDLKALIDGDPGDKFPKFSIRQGETVFEALQRGAQERDLILQSSTHGNLLLTKKGSSEAGTDLIEGENVLACSIKFNNQERYSDYIIKGQSTGLAGTPKQQTQSKASSKDLGIKRYRPLIVVSENAVDNNGAQKRAQWESSHRSAKACIVSVVVRGWKKKDKKIWSTNQLVNINCPSIGLSNKKLLIERVKFDESNDGGRRCELQLIRPDAFEFKKELKAEDDPLDSLGWNE